MPRTRASLCYVHSSKSLMGPHLLCVRNLLLIRAVWKHISSIVVTGKNRIICLSLIFYSVFHFASHSLLKMCTRLKISHKWRGPEWVSFPLVECDSSDATNPQTVKDIQSQFMAVLMSCPCLFDAKEGSLAWPVNVCQSCLEGAGSTE